MQEWPFDVNDECNLGRPVHFKLEDHVRAVESLIVSDEIEMALKLCDMLPAWYLEDGNYPRELSEIKQTLWRNLYSAYDYANDFDEANYTLEGCYSQYDQQYFYPRANVLAAEIKSLNDQGMRPWVHELSPSHGAMVLGLLRDGLKFNFFGQNLNAAALLKLKGWLPEGVWRDEPDSGQQKFLVSFESLEHMWREQDIEQAAGKLGHEYDSVFLSVPLGCLGAGLENWRTRRLGHIRGYNHRQFQELAMRMFPSRKWTYWRSHSQVLMGRRG